jgi:cyclopropane fatty-acyl-phospholipid synthase-like methyltransferase
MRFTAVLGTSLAGVLLLFGAFATPAAAQSAARTPQEHHAFTNKLAPYVASPAKVVDKMLELANLKPGETLYDLGCGDGRVLIAAAEKYKAKAVGVEISPRLVAKATANIAKQGVSDLAHVIEGDVLSADLSHADVVTIYLATSLNEKLRPRFERMLRPGARVISHDYAIPGWKATKVERTEDHHHHAIYVYEMPPTRTDASATKD